MKIGTIGSATQDIFILYEGAEFLHLHLLQEDHTYLLLEQGTKIDVPNIHYATGGGATNTGVGFKRLGLEVEAIFKTGRDHAALEILVDMKKEGVGTTYVTVDEQTSTATSFIIPSRERNHVVFAFRGANKHLKIEEFPLNHLQEFSYLYINPLSENSRLLLQFLAPRAQELGITVVINPGMGQIAHEPEEFIAALRHVDVLILNAFEARHLMKALLKNTSITVEKRKAQSATIPTLLENFLLADTGILTLYDFFREILNIGPSIVAVTNGAEGVYIGTNEKVFFHPSIPAQVVSGLGAGDAFSSGFAGSLALGKGIESAIRYGMINAWSVIQHPDAKQGLLFMRELEAKTQSLESGDLAIFPMPH